MHQRYIFYYIGARIIFLLTIHFLFPDIVFRDFFRSYRGYILTVSFSYFIYCYYIHHEEKKFQYLRNSLLIFNTYLTLHIFFRPILNIEPVLFLLLGCIIGGLRYISNLHIKIKRPFYLIGGILSFLIIISGMFYLYPDSPDITGFQAQQQNLLILNSPTSIPRTTAYLRLTNLTTNQQQDIIFQTGSQISILPSSYQISYISTTSESPAQSFIIFPNADLLQIHPQSRASFQEEIKIESGRFSRSPAPRTGNISIPTPLSSNETSNINPIPSHTYTQIASSYQSEFLHYLIQQMGSPLLANTTIQYVNTFVLTTLSKIFPGFFSQNITNQSQFEYYFSTFRPSNSIINTQKYSVSSNINTNQTNIFQQIKNNIQVTLPSLYIF